MTPLALTTGAPAHVVAVFDDDNDHMLLYVDGQLQGSAEFSGRLAGLADD